MATAAMTTDGTLVIMEEREKLKEGYIWQSLDRSTFLISPEIKVKSESNILFGKVLNTALLELNILLDKEIGKIGYIIEVSIEKDYEIPQWEQIFISIKIPIQDPKYINQLWKKVSEKIWKKVYLIEEDIEKIKKISHDIVIVLEILE